MSHDNEDLDALFDSIAAGVVAGSEVKKDDLECHQGTDQVQSDRINTGSEATASDSERTGSDDLYGRLGTIVRSLHDSLRELGLDKSLSESAASINDAKDRLAYIATLTEQAANKVLNTLDQAIPAQTELSTRAGLVNAGWKKMFEGTLSVEEFKALAEESLQFSEAVQRETEIEKARLLEIMMAQDFQDLTGQIIKKVITVTKDVERDLAQLLMDNAPPEVKVKVAKEKPVDLMSGPAVPAQAMAQDDVDDLLAGLGF
jgi:chemotaxis protein CheZ